MLIKTYFMEHPIYFFILFLLENRFYGTALRVANLTK